MLRNMQSTGKRESLPSGGDQGRPAPAAPAAPGYVTVKETANLLGVGPLYVYRRFHRRIFPGRRVGRKIDILAEFVVDLVAEIASGRSVDVEAFAKAWTPAATA